ncbi:MAG: SulP family inorganic anion transporter, partial [Kiritimatiellaceae bacterium]|nr:SulP family inorganic anion transporter [Kiritimatiellaceae bacterium]
MLKRLFPFLNWRFAKGDVRADFLAGLTVAFVLIPQSMAYAELAGLPAWIGLYAAFLPAILGGLWGSSNQLQTGPVAMISLLTASVLGTLAISGSAEYVQLAAKLAFMIGILWAVVAFLRLSFIINFVSRPVIEGFVHAAAVIIATSQLGKVLGIQMNGGEHYLLSLWDLLTRLNELNVASLTLGGIALIMLLAGRHWFPRVPVALLVVMLSVIVVYVFGLSDPERIQHPLAIVGEIPPGTPKPLFAVPVGREIWDLLPGALTIAFVGFMEMSSVARALAVRSHQKLNLNQEMVGQAFAAFGSAFSGGFPVSGSFSRSALNYATGARSGLSAIFTGLFVMVFLLGFTHALHYLPKTVLAAIIIAAVLRLMNFRKLWHFVEVNRADGFASFATFFATLLLAPHLEKGIVLGASLSILIHLYRMMRPHVALVAQASDGALCDAALHGLEIDRNLPAIRLDGRLFFANVAYFEEQVHAACDRFPSARQLAIICNGINEIDVSGTEMLKELAEQLQAQGIDLLFIAVKHQVMEVMRASELDRVVGTGNFFNTFDQAREEVYARLSSDLTY